MNQIDNYIQSFLNGSLGAEGHTVLRQWIKEKPENRYYFQAQVAIWKATGVKSNRFLSLYVEVFGCRYHSFNMRNFFLILFVAVGRESFRSCGRI